MKRTPREILLERHQAAEVRLDAVRERVLDQVVNSGNASPSSISFIFARLPIQIWKELFWSCRRVWTGLAAAWLVMIAVNLLNLDEPPVRQKMSRAAAPDIWAILAERERLMNETSEPALPAPAAQSPAVPRPRTEYRLTNRARC